jgi:hypothetical protein
MTGLHVGDGNVQQLFPPNMPTVELELDHLRILCTLDPAFWEGEAEIHDERLVAWLETKRASGKLAPRPSPMVLIPYGHNGFRLEPIQPADVQASKYAVGFAA